jgi:hypothetical protein
MKPSREIDAAGLLGGLPATTASFPSSPASSTELTDPADSSSSPARAQNLPWQRPLPVGGSDQDQTRPWPAPGAGGAGETTIPTKFKIALSVALFRQLSPSVTPGVLSSPSGCSISKQQNTRAQYYFMSTMLIIKTIMLGLL